MSPRGPVVRESRKATQTARDKHGFRPLSLTDQSSTADFKNAKAVNTRMSSSSKSLGWSRLIIGSRRSFASVDTSLIHSLLHVSQMTGSVTANRVEG